MVLVVPVQLAVDGVAWATIADAVWAPALSHKSWNDAVKFEPFVEPFFGQLDEVGHGVGGVLLEKLHGHGAVVGVDGCCHGAKVGQRFNLIELYRLSTTLDTKHIP